VADCGRCHCRSSYNFDRHLPYLLDQRLIPKSICAFGECQGRPYPDTSVGRHWSEPPDAVPCFEYSEAWSKRRSRWVQRSSGRLSSSLVSQADGRFAESAIHPELVGNPRVGVHPLAPPPQFLSWPSMSFFVSGPLKVLWQVYTLFRVLAYDTPPARWIIIQVCIH
jgi:hypothetical protein